MGRSTYLSSLELPSSLFHNGFVLDREGAQSCYAVVPRRVSQSFVGRACNPPSRRRPSPILIS